jgi:hypothetical protein
LRASASGQPGRVDPSRFYDAELRVLRENPNAKVVQAPRIPADIK